MRYYFTPTKRAKIKKITRVVGEVMEKSCPIYTFLVRLKEGAFALGNSLAVPQKAKYRIII